MEQAIHKNRRGYERIPLPQVGSFDEQYVALCRDVAPALVPGNKMLGSESPMGSHSMIFNHGKTFEDTDLIVMPRRFVHELGKRSGGKIRTHYAALTIAGWGNYLPELGGEFERNLSKTPYAIKSKKPTLKRPNQGLVLYAITPPVFHMESFEDQEDAIREGMLITDNLRQWFIENQNVFRRWSELIEKFKGKEF